MVHRCSSKTEDMAAEYQELRKLRNEKRDDLLTRTRNHLDASQQLCSRACNDTCSPEQTDQEAVSDHNEQARTIQIRAYPKKVTSENQAPEDMASNDGHAWSATGAETTAAYAIPGGWCMAFDLASGTPFFWHNDVNDGASTWNHPWPDKQCTKSNIKSTQPPRWRQNPMI